MIYLFQLVQRVERLSRCKAHGIRLQPATWKDPSLFPNLPIYRQKVHTTWNDQMYVPVSTGSTHLHVCQSVVYAAAAGLLLLLQYWATAQCSLCDSKYVCRACSKLFTRTTTTKTAFTFWWFTFKSKTWRKKKSISLRYTSDAAVTLNCGQGYQRNFQSVKLNQYYHCTKFINHNNSQRKTIGKTFGMLSGWSNSIALIISQTYIFHRSQQQCDLPWVLLQGYVQTDKNRTNV